MANTQTPVSKLAEAVMRAALAVITQSGKKVADVDQAVQVVTDEVREFIQGPRYADERECLKLGTVNERYIMASVVSSCVLKIKTL